jgi:hypothetical protein
MDIITRKDALAQGLRRFYTAKPCTHGHLSERLASNGRCCQCHAERQLRVYHSQATEEKLAFNRINSRPWELRKESSRRYEQKAYRENTAFRIAKCLRSRFYKAVTRNQRIGTTMQLVGCSVDFLRSHLQGQFDLGMSWDNFGEWHIDHIRPCASFDLSDPDQQRQCFHYSNLQPLWEADNIRKGAKWEAS